MILPKLKQDKDGNWRAKVGDKWKDLGKTSDYFIARERAARLAEGSSEPFIEPPKIFKEAGINGGDDWTADAVRNAAANGPSQSSEYFPPGAAPPIREEPTPEPSSDGPDASTEIPPEMMAGIIKQCAQTIVELQLHGQEYLWLRWGKIQPGEIAFDSEARKVPTALWETQLKKWFPSTVPIPEWAAAIILTAVMGGTLQFQGARPFEPGPGAAPQESST